MSQTSTQTTRTLAGDVVALPQQRSASDLDRALRPESTTAPEVLGAGTQIPARRPSSQRRPEDGPEQLTGPAVETDLAVSAFERSAKQPRFSGLLSPFTRTRGAEQIEMVAERAAAQARRQLRTDPFLATAHFLRGLR